MAITSNYQKSIPRRGPKTSTEKKAQAGTRTGRREDDQGNTLNKLHRLGKKRGIPRGIPFTYTIGHVTHNATTPPANTKTVTIKNLLTTFDSFKLRSILLYPLTKSLVCLVKVCDVCSTLVKLCCNSLKVMLCNSKLLSKVLALLDAYSL